MDRALQVELFGQCRKVIRIGVQVVAVPGLARSAMATAVMGNAPIAARGQKKHLVLECVRTQRPSVAEYNGLTRSPILLINLSAIFVINFIHVFISFV
jgi:hypothetical protein